MQIKTFVVGPIQTNCYLAADEGSREALVVDPDLREPEELRAVLDELKNLRLDLKYIVNTHGHADHIGGNAALKQATGAMIVVHGEDAPLLAEPWKDMVEMDKAGSAPACPLCGDGPLTVIVHENGKKASVACEDCGFQMFVMTPSPPADRLVRDADRIKIGDTEFLVIHTPGHTPGGIALYSQTQRALFSGDTLFKGSIGRTDLPNGSYSEIVKSLGKLSILPAETAVLPGHGEATTIGLERRENPYLQPGNRGAAG